MKNYRNVMASDHFKVGEIVSWVSKSGNQYSGSVVSIKERKVYDIRGALVTVEIDHDTKECRNFFENEVDAYALGL